MRPQALSEPHYPSLFPTTPYYGGSEIAIHASDPIPVGVVAFTLIISLFAYTKLTAHKHARRYPPGPPRLPIIGDMHNFPADDWGNVFSEWQKQYGITTAL